MTVQPTDYDNKPSKGPGYAVVYKDGSLVIAENADAERIASGVAGVDDATVINTALASKGIVALGPGTFVIASDHLHLMRNTQLVGSGIDMTIIDYNGSGTEAIYIDGNVDANTRGSNVKDLTIDAGGKIGLNLYANSGIITESEYKNLYIHNCTKGIYINSSHIYCNDFKNISILGATSHGIHLADGCYNRFSRIEVAEIPDGAYGILDESFYNTFESVASDGCLKVLGWGSTWIDTKIETVSCTTPVSSNLFDIAGSFNTIINTVMLEIQAKKCSVGLWVSGNKNSIINLLVYGTTYVPTYPFSVAYGNTVDGVGINIYCNAAIDWSYLFGRIALFKFQNCSFKTSNFGSSTGTGSAQTIAHRLVTAPIKVSVTPTVIGATVSSVWADATNIYVTVTNGKTYNWSAEV